MNNRNPQNKIIENNYKAPPTKKVKTTKTPPTNKQNKTQSPHAGQRRFIDKTFHTEKTYKRLVTFNKTIGTWRFQTETRNMLGAL